MKQIKRIGAIVLALVMMFALTATAFADGTVTTLPTPTEVSGAYQTTFTKAIELTGESGHTIYAPNVTYTYTTANTEIVSGTSTATYPTVTIGNAEFTNADSATSDANVSKNVTITINASASKAGIYKYTVTEASSNKTTNGVTAADNASSTRYLYVYVDNTLAVTTVTFGIEKTEGGTTTIEKTSDWNDGTPGSADSNVFDKYETVKVTIKKVIEGNLADPTHAFPFTFPVTFSNGSKVEFNNTFYDATGAALTTNMTANLANNGTAVIYGVPKNATATVTVTETNDTLDTYKVTTTNLATNLSSQETAAGATAGGATADITADTEIQFTNKLEDISPTGLVLRFAPFALLLVCALFLVVFARKRKADDRA